MDHLAEYRRYPRGRSAVFHRPLYGYRVTCSCGWEKRINGPLREAKEFYRDHVSMTKERP